MNTPLTPEQREKILSEIHEREALEAQALKEQKAARQAEAERMQHEERARAAQRMEAERRENILHLLNTGLKHLQEAISSFEQRDERETYRRLVRLEESRFSASQRLNRPPTRPDVAGVPTVKVKRAGTVQGWCIVNAEDVLPSDEIVEENG